MALIGLKYPVAAPVEKYESGKYPAIKPGTAFVIGKMISADKEVKFSDNPLYADNEKAENAYIFEDGTLKICVDHMELEAQAKMFGHTYTGASEKDKQPEEIIKGGADIPPYMAIGYYKTLFKNNKRLYEATIIFKVKFMPPKESAKTKEKSISWGTYESDGTIETLGGFENEPYEKTARFATEDEAKEYIEKFFAMSADAADNTEQQEVSV